MKRIIYTARFRKDHKRVLKRGYDKRRIGMFIDLLRTGEPLPPSARPHLLKGEWKGYTECHVGNDWLLIYHVTNEEVLLARIGSHADLFE